MLKAKSEPVLWEEFAAAHVLPEEVALEHLHRSFSKQSISTQDSLLHGPEFDGGGRENALAGPIFTMKDTATHKAAVAAMDGPQAHGCGDSSRDMHSRSLVITEPERDDAATGAKQAYMEAVLEEYTLKLKERTKYHLGYPYNLEFDYGALAPLQHFSINNLGDPFIESNYGVHSRAFEVGVLDWFARLWDLGEGEYWGYITNCGTEGNLHGILLGRESLPDGILYASRESHYSVFKAARMYRMECVKVRTHIAGDIDCEHLREVLMENRTKPAILNVNIGTTVKGAVDDLDLVLSTLADCGFSHDRFYIHCDGALFGLMMPFVKRAPRVTFHKPIGSVSVSGHKFVGCPMPCGVQITRIKHARKLSQAVEYLASEDATIMGSRNGHAPIFLWYTLNKKGYRGFRRDVLRCLRNAHYLHQRLRDCRVSSMLNPLSSTVVFERPADVEFVRKWQLACQSRIAHAVIMPSVDIAKIDDFVEGLLEARRMIREGREGQGSTAEESEVHSPCFADEMGESNCMCEMHFKPDGEENNHSALQYYDAMSDDSSRGGSHFKPSI